MRRTTAATQHSNSLNAVDNHCDTALMLAECGGPCSNPTRYHAQMRRIAKEETEE